MKTYKDIVESMWKKTGSAGTYEEALSIVLKEGEMAARKYGSKLKKECPLCTLNQESISTEEADDICLRSDRDKWCMPHTIAYMNIRKLSQGRLIGSNLVESVTRIVNEWRKQWS